ncbi:MAG: cation:proton antiporter, partial [Chloroflexi bacterium]|nr:cation:proton antiporter [Chloroflexota bacterium]
VILAMLVSRAVVVYGLMPIVGLLPGEGAVNIRYRTVIYWGGLRGAIALAIVLSLDPNPATDSFVVLVTGAVLFTLIVQGLTIKPLVVKLGLDTPPVTDQFARAESELAAKERAIARKTRRIDSTRDREE